MRWTRIAAASPQKSVFSRGEARRARSHRAHGSAIRLAAWTKHIFAESALAWHVLRVHV